MYVNVKGQAFSDQGFHLSTTEAKMGLACAFKSFADQLYNNITGIIRKSPSTRAVRHAGFTETF